MANCEFRILPKDIGTDKAGPIKLIVMTGMDENTAGCVSRFNIDFPVCPKNCLTLTEETCEFSPKFTGVRSDAWQLYLKQMGLL